MPEPPPRRTPEEKAAGGTPPPAPGAPEPPPQHAAPSQAAPPPKAKKRKKPGQRGIGTYVFFVVIAGLVAFGGLQLYEGLFGDKSPALGDHIHAALGVNICGNQVENAPSFEEKADGEEKAGLHSHGDGLIHMHPFTDDETGSNATVGLFFEYGGWSLSEDSMSLSGNGWADIDVNNGQPCLDGRVSTLRWSVNGEEQDGNPADFAPDDQDVISIAFIPEGDAIPGVPDEVLQTLPNPSDVKQDG